MKKSDDATMGCALLIMVLIIGAFILTRIGGGCGSGYSEGQRSGELRKFSRKGIAYKSWEGTLLLSNGYIRTSDGRGGPDVWNFSVTDPAVAEQLDRVPPGKRVTIHYQQYLVAPISQDSKYTAVRAEVQP